MKIGVFFTVRLGSTRLPNKAILCVKDTPLISYTLRRFKQILKNQENIHLIICTTTNSEDYYLQKIAETENVLIFHGDPENILKRHLDCAKEFNIDYVVNVDADDVLCDPALVLELLPHMQNYDITKTEGYPFGVNLFAYSVKALQSVLGKNESNDIDTGWGELFKENHSLTNFTHKATEEEKDNVRLSLDYEEDLVLFTKLIEGLEMDKNHVSQETLLSYIRKNPFLREINSGVEAKYWQNYNKKKVKGD